MQSQDPPRAGPETAPSSSAIPIIQRSIGEALGHSRSGQDSPVMNETLSVIDEHITDLSTPRHSLAAQDRNISDSASEYSSHLDRRHSHGGGSEMEDVPAEKLTESLVKKWDSKQTADHLRKLGVDPKHCDIFEEQEITGDVLLDMDQQFIYMKEFEFGLMGKRLKTWHIIRDFQEEIRIHRHSRQTSAGAQSDTPTSFGQSSPRFPVLPKIPGLEANLSRYAFESDEFPTALQTQPLNARSPSPSVTTWHESLESPVRPSAASVREYSHSRRHSSMDTASQSAFDSVGSTLGNQSITHRKQNSLDREWSLSSATAKLNDSQTPTCE